MTSPQTDLLSQQDEISGTLRRVLSTRGAWFAGRIETRAGLQVSIAGVNPSGPPPIDSELKLTGSWEDSPYGRQFKFTACEMVLPSNRDGVLRYLGILPGVGPARARAIYEELGDKAVERVFENPAILHSVKGLSRYLDDIIPAVEKMRDTMTTDKMLCSMGFGEATRANIIEHFADGLAKVLRTNPYRLVVVRGVSFHRVDTAVLSLRMIAEESPERAAAALVFAARELHDQGHTWLGREALLSALSELKLGTPIPPDAIERGFEIACKSEMLAFVPGKDGATGYAWPPIAKAEEEIAARLSALMANPTRLGSVENVPANRLASLTDKQRAFVEMVVESPVVVLTGGPGTGKTFSTNAALDALGREHCIIIAPTGKAAKRAAEVTGHESLTIHRYVIDLQHGEGTGSRVLIIDESSMLDVPLLAELLRAAPRTDLRIIFVGDIDQLPSVGPGRVLGDLIACRRVPVVRLSLIMRQSLQSRIITNSHAINAGRTPDLTNSSGDGDWFSILHFEGKEDGASAREATALAARIPDMVERARDRWGFDTINDIQVLTPVHKGELGTEKLNDLLRFRLNPKAPGKSEIMGGRFRVGDKVIVTKNNYELGVVNGDIGVIKDAGTEQGADGKMESFVKVALDQNRVVTLKGAGPLGALSQAWALTVHKAQGSEYPFVIVVCHRSQFFGLQRAILYTALTRAKKRVVLVGNAMSVAMAVKNNKQAERFTRLGHLLAEKCAARVIEEQTA